MKASCVAPASVFVNIDNIADLTLEEVREILEKEEQANAQLKEDLVSTKEEELTKHQNQPKIQEKIPGPPLI